MSLAKEAVWGGLLDSSPLPQPRRQLRGVLAPAFSHLCVLLHSLSREMLLCLKWGAGLGGPSVSPSSYSRAAFEGLQRMLRPFEIQFKVTDWWSLVPTSF